MTHFACRHCGSKLQVKETLAGKQVRCPSCQRMLEVPADAIHDLPTLPPTAAPSPEDDATLPPRAEAADSASAAFNGHGPALSAQAAPADVPGTRVHAGVSYQLGKEIARGGMGAVLRAVDQDIQREVAVKFLLKEGDACQKARFIEEAQITGQLEHPNIVPIHQLGVVGDGRCFFSMKMVKGKSLAQVLTDVGQAASGCQPVQTRGQAGTPPYGHHAGPPAHDLHQHPARTPRTQLNNVNQPTQQPASPLPTKSHQPSRRCRPHPGRRRHGHARLYAAGAGQGRRRRSNRLEGL